MEQIPSDISVSNAQNSEESQEKKISKKRRINIFTNLEKLDFIRLLAIHTPVAEVQKYIKDKYGKHATKESLYQYRETKSWKSYIDKCREDFEDLIADEPYASKRIRIKEYSKAYLILMKKEKISDAVNVLTKIREEVEGKSCNPLSFTQYNQYNNVSDDDLRKIIVENSKFLEGVNHVKQIKGEPDALLKEEET